MMLGYVTLWTIELFFSWENVLWFLWCHIWFWACAIKIDCEKYLEKVNRYLQCRLKLSPGWGAVSRQLSCWCYYSWRLQATRFAARCLCHSCGNSSPVPSGHAPFEYSLKVINPIKWVISKLSVFMVGNGVVFCGPERFLGGTHTFWCSWNA